MKTWLRFLFNRVDVILRTPKNLELHILKFNAFGDVANLEQVLFHSLNRRMPLAMLLTLVAKLKQVLFHSLNRKMPLAMLLTLVAKLKQVLFHSLNRNIRCAQTSCHLLPSIARQLTVPPNAALPPLAGNYLFNGILLEF